MSSVTVPGPGACPRAPASGGEGADEINDGEGDRAQSCAGPGDRPSLGRCACCRPPGGGAGGSRTDGRGGVRGADGIADCRADAGLHGRTDAALAGRQGVGNTADMSYLKAGARNPGHVRRARHVPVRLQAPPPASQRPRLPTRAAMGVPAAPRRLGVERVWCAAQCGEQSRESRTKASRKVCILGQEE